MLLHAEKRLEESLLVTTLYRFVDENHVGND